MWGMNKITGFAILIVGCVLLYFGWQAHESVASGVSSAITGVPTDRSLWLLALGLIAAIAGIFSTMRGNGNAH